MTQPHSPTKTQHAMIIGATGAIGSATLKALESSDTAYTYTLVGRDTQKLGNLKRTYPNADTIPCDVSDELEVHALFQESAPVDVLVYAVGAVDPNPIKLTAADSWHTVMDANVTGVFYVLKYVAANLASKSKDAPKARVFVVGARPELVTYRSFSAYAASKAAVAKLVDVAAIEMKRHAAFTLVLPKAVDSDFWEPVGKVPDNALEPQTVGDAIVESLHSEPQEELYVG